MVLSERERAIRLRLKGNLEHYTARCLKIRTKAGNIEPLLFNRMQRYLHARIEDHARRNGRVRVLILKARQQALLSYDLNQRLQLESKERMPARGIRSPDEWDAVVLTFAEPVKDTSHKHYAAKPSQYGRAEGGPPLSWSTSRSSSSEDRGWMAS